LLEPGSALTLVWRAAQEVCGLQGAVAIPQRSAGAVTKLLADAAVAAGVVLRTGAKVERILIDAERVAGVELAYRETILCRSVLSSLSHRNTLLGLAPEAVPFGQARELGGTAPANGSALVALALDDAPRFGEEDAARFVRVDSLESIIAAEIASRAGRLPDELAFETIVSSRWDTSVAPPGGHVVTCLVRPVPRIPVEGWNVLKPRLTAKVIAALDRMSPGLVPAIVSVHAVTPDEIANQDDATTPERILASWRERTRTPIPGLFLCGVSAEPVAAVSGRAGRIAAAVALAP
jgi:phytoene dehydrogenase-like protein